MARVITVETWWMNSHGLYLHDVLREEVSEVLDRDFVAESMLERLTGGVAVNGWGELMAYRFSEGLDVWRVEGVWSDS